MGIDCVLADRDGYNRATSLAAARDSEGVPVIVATDLGGSDLQSLLHACHAARRDVDVRYSLYPERDVPLARNWRSWHTRSGGPAFSSRQRA